MTRYRFSTSVFAAFLVVVILLSGCQRIQVFSGGELSVIQSIDVMMDDFLHIHQENFYAESGMPTGGTRHNEYLWEEAEELQLQDVNESWSAQYDKKTRTVKTSGLFSYTFSENGQDQQQYVDQTLIFDEKGRLLSWQVPEMEKPYTYQYDEGRTLVSINDEAVYTASFQIGEEQSSEKVKIDLLGMYIQVDDSWSKTPSGDLTSFNSVSTVEEQENLESESNTTATLSGTYDDKGRLLQTYDFRKRSGEETTVQASYAYEEGPDPISVTVRNDSLEETDKAFTVEYRYEKERLLEEIWYSQAEHREERRFTYTYDEKGHLQTLVKKTEGITVTYTFETVRVTDPVIYGFLMTKPCLVNGSYFDANQGPLNDSMFVLTMDPEDAGQFGYEHYCWHCARRLAAPVCSCPYCGHAINEVEWIPDIWALDGDLVKY